MTNQEAVDLIRRAQAEIEWGYTLEYAAAFDKAVEALEAAEWKNVKDKPPEHGKKYIVYATSGRQQSGAHYNSII